MATQETPSSVGMAMPARPAPQPKAAPARRPEPEQHEPDDAPVRTPRRWFSRFMRTYGAFVVSVFFHAIVLFLLAWLTLPGETKQQVTELVANMFEEEMREEELLTYELQEQIEASEQMEVAVAALNPVVGVAGAGSAGSVSGPVMDKKLVEQLEGTEVNVEAPALSMPSSKKLIDAIPDGALGEERAIVDNYDQAMSQITKEILWMLDKSDVLVVWCFDMSESMKDDQQEIRDRIDRVYAELGLHSTAQGGRLTTAVTSYGSKFFVNSRRPTDDLNEIRAAIDSVQIDPSGEEMMCTAIGKSISTYRDYAKKSRRQMALILVSDESGDRANNDQYLELAIEEAKKAKCRLYVLGREASFGYPHARFSWQHPETKRWHWLIVDRGPETAYPEQLQTNGFHRRWDFFSSGFGPYEQTRMSKETNGIFFMLPSVELDLVGANKRRYELEAMRSYKPDLRPKTDVWKDIEAYPLRGLMMKVVSDLNPLESAQKARLLEMRVDFAINPADFVRQARESQQKALAYMVYLGEAEKVLLDNRRLREQEVSPRWQGNYDLMLAQLVAYQARMYEYGVYLEYVINNPLPIPEQSKTLSNGRLVVLVDWNIATRQRILADDESIPYPKREIALEYMARAKDLFQEVIDNHPGTPWAERAQWEMARGFGVELVPDYDDPIRDVTPTIPVPKL